MTQKLSNTDSVELKKDKQKLEINDNCSQSLNI